MSNTINDDLRSGIWRVFNGVVFTVTEKTKLRKYDKHGVTDLTSHFNERCVSLKMITFTAQMELELVKENVAQNEG